MPLDIEAALRRGINRTVARNGLLLAGVLFVISSINALVGLGVTRWMTRQGVFPRDMPFPSGMEGAFFAVPPAVGSLVSLLAALASIVITIGALRTFVSDETEQLPGEHFTRNLVWPGLNFVVGAIVFGIIVAIGFVFLVIPGLFLLVALGFWAVFVAVEDRNFVEGLQASWGLTRGHRLRIFLLGVAVVIIEIIVSAVFGIGFAAGAIGVVIAQIGSALTTVFTLATLAAAYDQLVSMPSEGESTSTEADASSDA